MPLGHKFYFKPDFSGLIRQCCQEGSDRQFTVFTSVWDPYLEAALARFIPHWRYVDAVLAATHEEYRLVLRLPFNEKLDYERYFLAIAYAHVARLYGESRLGNLLNRVLAAPSVPATHPLYVLTFYAIFRLSNGCLYPLLSEALSFRGFHFGFRFASHRHCEGQLKDALEILLR